MGREQNSVTCFAGFSKAMLVLINLAFIGIGAFFIYFSVSVTESGWVQVFSDSYPWFKDATFYSMLGFGAVIILIAFLGCCGAWADQKCFLKVYTVFVLLAFCAFFVITLGALLSESTANDWNSREYPADPKEVTVAGDFDTGYCYSQATFYCNDGNVTTALQLFYPEIPADTAAVFSQAKGINSACKSIGDAADISFIQSACDLCADTTRFDGFEKIFTWSEEECPITNEVAPYCVTFLTTGVQPEDPFNGAPYGLCRSPVLSFFARWASRLGIIAAVFAASSLILVIFICCSKRKESTSRDHYTTDRDP